MKPRPPIWIISRIIHWPNMLQCRPVSTTERPVTQVADVAVNRQVRKSVGVPAAEETGSVRIDAPVRITARNISTMICGGFILRSRYTARFRNRSSIPFVPSFVKILQNIHYTIRSALRIVKPPRQAPFSGCGTSW